jgi:hypothetical protein
VLLLLEQTDVTIMPGLPLYLLLEVIDHRRVNLFLPEILKAAMIQEDPKEGKMILEVMLTIQTSEPLSKTSSFLLPLFALYT